MKKLLFALLLISSFASAQPGYTKINSRYDWLAGRFDSGFHVPGYNGVPTGVRGGVWIGDGAIAVDTLNGYFYYRNGGVWIKVAKYSDLPGVITASNGLTRTGNDITLGGTLSGNTDVNLGSNRMRFQSSGTGKFYAEGLREWYFVADDNTYPQIVFRSYGNGTGGNNSEWSSTGSSKETGFYSNTTGQTDSIPQAILYSGDVPAQVQDWTNATAVIARPNELRMLLAPGRPKNWKIVNLNRITDTTGYDVIIINRTDSSVKRIPSTSIGGSGGAPALSAITAATGSNDINNGSNNQIWRWNSLVGGDGFNISTTSIEQGTLMTLQSTSTARLTNGELLFIASSGANATNGVTSVGQRISVLNTNATSGTNIGLDITTSGATTNNIALTLREPTGSGTNFTGFKTQAQSADLVYTLPAAFGTGSSNYALTDAAGDGTLTWAAASGGSGITVGTTTITSGTTKAIPFNDGGVYGEDASVFAWDKTNNRLGIGTASPGFDLDMNTAGSTTLRLKTTGASEAVIRRDETDAGILDDRYYASTSGFSDKKFIGYDANNGQVVITIGPHTAGRPVAIGYNQTVGATPNSSLQVTGSFATGYVAKTGTYTATMYDYTIECTANTFTVTLPTAVGIAGRIYTVVNSGAGTITLATTSSQTFVNVVATPTSMTKATLGTLIVQSNGANWMLISNL